MYLNLRWLDLHFWQDTCNGKQLDQLDNINPLHSFCYFKLDTLYPLSSLLINQENLSKIKLYI